MKKYIGLALILFLLTGCSIHRVEEESFESIIDTVLYKDTTLYNTSFDGYKLYLPRGSTVEEKKEYNLEIKNNKNIYYLYVDTISYYYKTIVDHDIDNNIFYSKNLSYKNSYGYIDITEIGDKYFLEMMYNYTKIETYVEKKYLQDAFLDTCRMLSTIKFNDSAISYKLSNRELVTTTDEFSIFKSKKKDDNFLKYVEKYDRYENNNQTAQDQDIIETED